MSSSSTKNTAYNTQSFNLNNLDASGIGYWEVNLEDESIFWSKCTKEIHHVPEKFEPDFKEAIEFYPEGKNRDTILQKFNAAVEKHENYDVELQIKTYDNKLKWVRAVGYPQFKDGKCYSIQGLFIDIDKKHNLLIETRLKERQFKLMFENAPIGMALVGLDGSWLDLNKKVCEIVGYTEEELLNLTFQDITYPDDVDIDVSLVKDLIEGKDDKYFLNKRYIHKEGHLVWIELGVSIVRSEEGEPLFFISQIRDINNERKAIEALKKNERRLDVIFNSTFQFIGLLNTDGVLLNANQTAINFAGLEKKDVVGLKFWDTYWWQISKKTQKKLKNSIQKALNKEFIQYEVEVWGANKSVVTIAFSINPVIDENGEVSSLIVEGRPIQDIVDARQELNDALNRLQSILEASTHVAIIGMDLDGRVTSFNVGAENLLGYESKEIVNQEDYLLFLLPNEVKEYSEHLNKEKGVKAKGFNAITYEVRKGSIESVRKKYLRKDGSILHVLSTMTLIRDEIGKISGYLEISSDITEINNAEKEINSLLDVTQNQNKRLLNFAHIVSHNLRSHVANQSVIMDMLNKEHPVLTKTEHFSMLNKSVGNLKETMSHLTEIVSVNSESSKSHGRVNLSKIIAKCIYDVNALLKETKAEIKNHVPENIIIRGVPAYLESIFLNLLTNSIKYRSKKRNLLIEIKYELEGDQTIIYYSDNGIGIDLDKHSDKLFGLYKTFHDHPEARGLGLFMTKNQIEAMGGEIEARSRPDNGLKYIIKFRHEEN
ncbi:MAG: PAS domain S-box protein [Cytophagales bacterium]